MRVQPPVGFVQGAPGIAHIAPPQPESGAAILVLKWKWWFLVAAGTKTLEIRHQPLAAQRRYVGHTGFLWGAVTFGAPLLIEGDEDWRRLLAFHRWDVPSRPYKNTYAMPVLKVEVFSSPVMYMAKHGQVGTAKYLPPRGMPEAQAPRKRPAAKGTLSQPKRCCGPVTKDNSKAA